MRFLIFVVLILCAGCANQQTRHVEQIDPEALLRCYERNNRALQPIVECIGGGLYHQFLMYPDGQVLVADIKSRKAGSGMLSARLSPSELTNILAQLSSEEGFWGLKDRYGVRFDGDEPIIQVTVRIPGHPEKTVSVYTSPNKRKPPEEFTRVLRTIRRIRPEGLKPWDPGYVVVLFCDARVPSGRTVNWPDDWPGLNTPLVRGEVVGKMTVGKSMIFPSRLVPDLEALLPAWPDNSYPPTHSAILIDGWKAQFDYFWPLPGKDKRTYLR
jgi:hypothetical protein